MTKKDKISIITRIGNMTYKDIQELKDYINIEWLYNTKHRISHYKGGKWATRVKESGYYLNNLLELPIQNDAPRGGQDGDYIIIKNNKVNSERVDFIRSFLSIY